MVRFCNVIKNNFCGKKYYVISKNFNLFCKKSQLEFYWLGNSNEFIVNFFI